ncbi:PREDICTED: RNA polymerase sigma factor sigD, chloroplastic isoform X1 [Populus euphratica]|uniref:RNA polymerase sigma factor sigD, chloroplastic isoform X1 n=1 Tax=Populus euphratica TaxID=75702 RepID=A0AAJ6UA70_POPEU|nr:PREDICTED: RNA polymerase sigma factor sigD, chloroplastic isoform X1 [Populus euphratica]
MAIITTICSSSTTIFSAIPSLKHPLSHQSPPPTSSPPSFKLGVSSISNEAELDIENATEAVALSSWTGGEVLFDGESDNGGLKARRRKRRKRRKGLAQSLVVDDGERDVGHEYRRVILESVKRGYLSPKEEAEFSMCLKHEARIEAARRRIGDVQELDPTSKQLAKALRMEKNTVDNVLCKGRESREKIIRSYRRLVVSIATSYQDKGLSLQDLIQEGSIGLLRGAERFDPQRGYKLSTYVYWWIKEAILTAISNNTRMVRLPRRWWMLVAKIAGANNDLSNKLRRSPSYDEIAEVLNMKVSTVRLGFERGRSPISLDQAVLGQNSLTLQEIIPGPDETIPENMVKRELLKQELEKLFQTVLTEREAHILRLHFGLNGQTPQSCEEIGRLVKLSRERVRQIICTALSKLRHKRIVEPLKAYAV